MSKDDPRAVPRKPGGRDITRSDRERVESAVFGESRSRRMRKSTDSEATR